MSRRRRRRQQHLDIPNAVMKVGDIVSGGRALGRTEDGRVCLVAYAAPGETVEVRFEREHAGYLEGVVERVVEPSPERVEAPCPVFGECGGCQLQHLRYEAQLEAKRCIVDEQLRRIGGLQGVEVRRTIGMADPWHYRNHVRFSTGPTYGDLGFIRRTGRGLLRIDHCPISDDFVNETLPNLQGLGRGLHQVQIRHCEASDSYLVTPEIEGAPLDTGQATYVERLGGRDFEVSASSFFQVNTAQAEKLVTLVGDELPPTGRLLVDAYAGVGTFAALFAGRFEQVIAIEESASAIRDATMNTHGISNIALEQGKVEDVLPKLEIEADVVLLDPARPGCAPPVLDAITTMRPAVVVYVSCNPSTLARDLAVLAGAGYAIEHVTPIDMFPQTAHIESVTRLSLESGA